MSAIPSEEHRGLRDELRDIVFSTAIARVIEDETPSVIVHVTRTRIWANIDTYLHIGDWQERWRVKFTPSEAKKWAENRPTVQIEHLERGRHRWMVTFPKTTHMSGRVACDSYGTARELAGFMADMYGWSVRDPFDTPAAVAR